MQYEIPNGFLGMRRDVILRLMGYAITDEMRQILGISREIYLYKDHPYFQEYPIHISIDTYLKIYDHLVLHAVGKNNDGSYYYKEKHYYLPWKLSSKQRKALLPSET
jgi:hypothetical protein